MKTLLEKEIRLLLPAFAAALLMAVLPVWLLPAASFYLGNIGDFTAYLCLFGIMMLALSSFGREIGLKTLPFILAQPLGRARIWWIKVAVLALFIALAFDAWWLSDSLFSCFHRGVRLVSPEVLANAILLVAVLTAGGLWMTLLLRQVASALWLTLLIPMAATIAIQMIGGPGWMLFALLGLYAVAGFFLARWQFLHFQDTAWTGGVVSLGRARAATEQGGLRERRPWAALFQKELQLHQFTLAGIAALFFLHLGVVMLRKAGAHVFGHTTLLSLEMFGGIWLIVPLLAGSQSVAEERQLGTLDGLLCLSVSRKVQFAVKLLFVLVLGGLLSAALLGAVEAVARAMGAGVDLQVMGIRLEGSGLIPVFLVFLTLSLIAFYASTLTRSLVQAMAAGMVATFVFWLIHSIATDSSQAFNAFGWKLWPAMAYPALTAALLWLAYGNFRWAFESERRWRRNILGLAAVIVLISGAAAALYHRVWERVMPLEGAHGPARLPAGKPVLLSGLGYRLTRAILLPDGRLWEDVIAVKNLSLGGGKNHFVNGSNWVAVFPNLSETVAIRSDGTLWVSEKPLPWPWFAEGPPQLVQFGVQSDWQSLVGDSVWSFVLLKRDGTLWRWGTNYDSSNARNYQNPGLRAFLPHQLGADSDWARILRGDGPVYAWKRDGSAWELHEAKPNQDAAQRSLEVELSPETAAARMPGLDHVQFKSLNWCPIGYSFRIGVRDDGTLWYWDWSSEQYLRRQGALSPAKGLAPPTLVQIGNHTNWVAVASALYQLVALKTDGSIWQWNLDPHFDRQTKTLQNPPARLGTNSDWVSVGCVQGQIAALAADGSLWRWPEADLGARWYWYPDQWLAPSRRPAKIENILGPRE